MLDVLRVVKTKGKGKGKCGTKDREIFRLLTMTISAHKRLALWLALAADDFWYSSMKRSPKTAAARVTPTIASRSGPH